MPPVGVHREFLHRACIQFSSPLTGRASVEAESQHALRFVRQHAPLYADEIARALVWRVVDTNDSNEKDRAGAWAVLHAVLLECGDSKNDLSRTVLAEKISLFLPYLIAHRWYSTMPRQPSEGQTGAASTTKRGSGIDTSGYGKVVPAAVINGDDFHVVDVRRSREQIHFYRGLLHAWKALWRSDVYQQLKETVRDVERHGNYLSAKGAEYLSIPSTFKDSLWRLCRRTPRPCIALHVLYCFGWKHKTEPVSNNNVVRPHTVVLPTSLAEVESLDSTMHPGVKAWMEKLIEHKGGCRLCDTWRHEEVHCPCERPFVKTPNDLAAPGGRGARGAAGSAQSALTYMEAVEKLHRSGIRMPLRVDEALDSITTLIQQEKPYEEMLTAFDIVRGAVTGPLERHALWLHSTYHVLPSKTLFEKPSDSALSPSMEIASAHFIANRRFREWELLQQAVDVLDGPFRRRTLPPTARAHLTEVQETCSFFFCLVDGSLPPSFTPGLYARVPEEVVSIAALKDILCKCCLEPFHSIEYCTSGGGGDGAGVAEAEGVRKEPWDLQVARLVLEDNHLLDMRYPEEEYRLQESLLRIDMDDRQAKEFRKKELQLAVRLIHEQRVPLCTVCNVAGHSTRRCVVSARRVLAREGISEVDMRLSPQSTVERRLKELHRERKDVELRELREAYNVLGRGTKSYPSSYAAAIREFADARIPLAAARYSTDAVQNFLLHINSSDLLQHLAPLRDADFPEVCLFCDSFHHTSDTCSRAQDEERGFLAELRRFGLSLWAYLVKPQHYDERLPTDFMQGKRGVLKLVQQFDEDYAPGGLARLKFIEYNGLEAIAAASQLAAGSTYGLSSQKPLGSQRESPYGVSFSQLIAPATIAGNEAAPGPQSSFLHLTSQIGMEEAMLLLDSHVGDSGTVVKEGEEELLHPAKRARLKEGTASAAEAPSSDSAGEVLVQ